MAISIAAFNSSLPLRNLLAKGDAFDKLASDKVQSISLPEFINGENVGMIQGGRRVCFLLETAQTTLIAGQLRREHFERNLAS